MASVERELKTDRLHLRITQRQRRLIEEAAAAEESDLSSFVLEAATLHAQRVLRDATTIRLSPEAWEAFAEALDRPPRDPAEMPALTRLLGRPETSDG